MGLEPMTFHLQRHCFTHWGMSHLCSVYAQGWYCYLGQLGFHPFFGSPEKTEYFEYRHMGENPFFRPLLVQAKFPAVDCESLTPTRGATQQSVGIKKKKERRWEAKWHSRGSPTKGSKSRSVPQQRGTKSEVAASPLPSRGPKRGRKCYVTPAFSGCTTEGGETKVARAGLLEKIP